MKCLDDGHTYELENFVPQFQPETLVFGKMIGTTRLSGVTNEEVLRALIHRITFLNEKWSDGKFRCRENYLAIIKLEEALMWLDKRTADRLARKVEGTHEK